MQGRIGAVQEAPIVIGKGACDTCHVGPAFTNGEFHDTGIPLFVRLGESRSRPLRRHEEPARRPHEPARPQRSTATGTRHVSLEQRNFGEFKVPSLRNLESSMPYMHNGSLATLRGVVKH